MSPKWPQYGNYVNLIWVWFIEYLVLFPDTTSEVDHGLDGGAALEGLVAAVHLGIRLLNQRRPELVFRLGNKYSRQII